LVWSTQCGFGAKLDSPFQPVIRVDDRTSGLLDAAKGLSFGWDAETLPGEVTNHGLGVSAECDNRARDDLPTRAKLAAFGWKAPRVCGIRHGCYRSSPSDVSDPCFDRLNEDFHGPDSPTPT
jgi:hypothetical protein